MDFSKLSKKELIKLLQQKENSKKTNKKEIKKKKLEYKGDNVYYKTIHDIKKKLNITQQQAKDLKNDYIKNNVERYIVDIDNEDVGKFDLTKKPLLLKDFGIKRINNKSLLTNDKINKNGVFITESLPDLNYNLILNISYIFKVSEQFILRNAIIKTNKKPSQINIENEIENYIINNFNINMSDPQDIPPPLTYKTYGETFEEMIQESINNNEPIIGDLVKIVALPNYLTEIKPIYMDDNYTKFFIVANYQIIGEKTKQEFELINGKLRDVQPLDLSNLFNEDINNNEWKDCVRDYLKDTYKKISENSIDKYGDEEGVSPNDLLLFSKKYSIKMVCYDIEGNVILSYYPEKKSKYKNLIFIAYNNHLYPLKNSYLSDRKNEDWEFEYIYGKNMFRVDNITNELIKNLENGILPKNILLNSSQLVKSFVVNNIKYFENSDYDICLKILSLFGLADKITISTTLMNVINIIEKLYIKSNINSYCPYFNRFVKGGYNYTKSNINDDEIKDLTSIDLNKCFMSCLHDLDYLLSYDIVINSWNNKKEIKDNYQYLVRPEKHSFLLPETNIYDGKFLNYCKSEGLKFEILEGYECKKHDNYYKQLIDDLYKKLSVFSNGKELFKKIMVVFIGKMERTNKTNINFKFNKIVNDDELKRSNGYFKKLNDKYYIMYSTDEKNDYINRKPITIQIKDMCRKKVYEMMKNLKLKDNDIYQIQTDSITFKKDKLKYISDKLGENIGEWKETKTKIYNFSSNIINNNDDTILIKTEGNSYLFEGDAGCGKTYYIKNTLLKNIDNDYIILTPSHKAKITYQKDNIKCNVIQFYTLNNKLPTEKNIIVDEIGMCDKKALKMLFNCVELCKNIYAFGDFTQLLPVDKENKIQLNGELFMNILFNERHFMDGNYRNKFDKEYYDYLRYDKTCNYLKEIKKYESDLYKSEVVICYENSTVDKYNKIISENLGIKNKCSIGAKLICKTNKLRILGIYNKFYLDVIKIDNDIITLYDGINEYEVNRKYIEDDKYFKFRYAQTIYCLQGDTIQSFKFAHEDRKYLDGRTTYTIISRLKQ